VTVVGVVVAGAVVGAVVEVVVGGTEVVADEVVVDEVVIDEVVVDDVVAALAPHAVRVNTQTRVSTRVIEDGRDGSTHRRVPQAPTYSNVRPSKASAGRFDHLPSRIDDEPHVSHSLALDVTGQTHQYGSRTGLVRHRRSATPPSITGMASKPRRRRREAAIADR
jgi:hypothetical protein